MKGKPFTQEETDYLKKHYADEPTSKIAEHLSREIWSVYNKAYSLGLQKSEAFMKSPLSGGFQKGSTAGAAYRFKPGQKPKNTGLKQSEYMTAEAIDRTKATRFKKGDKVHNEKSDGQISIRRDSGGRLYQFIRTSKAKWIHLHVFLWEKEHGKIPEGGIIRFKDGNSLNCIIENLELINRSENMARNTIQRYPEEVKEVIRLTGKLKRTITKKEKDHGKK